MRDKTKIALIIALFVLTAWAGITSAIYRFSNPEKTETQAFLHLPQSMMLNFKDGE